jgi:dTDP-4-dehydrorhamnose reductase
MRERLEQNLGIAAPGDQLFSPTFIDDIALALDVLVQKNASGIYHVVGSSVLSPFDAATIIATEYGFDTNQITKVAFAEFFKNRAPTPQYAALSNDKITALGITMHTFAEGVHLMHTQES